MSDTMNKVGDFLASFYSHAREADAVTIVGLIALFFASLSAANFLADFVLPGQSLTKYGGRSGKAWAVVTGASDGIGAEYVRQLAGNGFNILLVSRTQSKLDALAKEVEARYRVKTQTLAIDASTATDADYAKIKAAVDALDEVGVLVNNVGQSHDIPVSFADTELAEMRQIIDINVHFTLRMTHLLLPKLKQRKSLILTMGSFGGYLPTPYLATYSGSKAFLETWSIALASELADSSVTVRCVNSYLVTSKMSKIRKPSMTIPTPTHFVAATLMSIKAGHALLTPHWAHALMAYALHLLGRNSSAVVEGNKRMHKAIRARALKKKARAAKSE